MEEKDATINSENAKMQTKSKLVDFVALTKPRLNIFVVLSAVLCYLMAAKQINAESIAWLVLGGYLITGASNGFNMIIEKDIDKLMNRTCNRPLPSGRLTINEAFIFSSILALAGIFILTYFINLKSGLLGTLALVLYVAAYTPLKTRTPFAVFVGAFPGAIPPMLGWVAATDAFDIGAIIVFALQFMWQFPHFWAIAWRLDDDYKKAGLLMLPSNQRDKASAFQILIYTLMILPVSLTPYAFNLAGPISAVIIGICSVLFFIQALKLYRTLSLKAASELMFGSFIYLPVVQLSLIIDKV
ncbi:MAG: heme o synthase [Bacteroidota bacterium]